MARCPVVMVDPAPAGCRNDAARTLHLAALPSEGVGRPVAAAATELEVVELVLPAVAEWDTVMYLQAIGAAALDAHRSRTRT